MFVLCRTKKTIHIMGLKLFLQVLKMKHRFSDIFRCCAWKLCVVLRLYWYSKLHSTFNDVVMLTSFVCNCWGDCIISRNSYCMHLTASACSSINSSRQILSELTHFASTHTVQVGLLIKIGISPNLTTWNLCWRKASELISVLL